MTDAYDRWIEWVDKAIESTATFPDFERDAITALPLGLRRNRAAVNEAAKQAHEGKGHRNEDGNPLRLR